MRQYRIEGDYPTRTSAHTRNDFINKQRKNSRCGHCEAFGKHPAND